MALNTLTSIRTQAPGLANEKIDNNTLLRALAYSLADHVLYNLGEKQKVKRNAGTNTVQWRGYKPLPVADNRHIITEGVNPDGMKVGARTVTGTVAVYGAYLEVTRQVETYNLDQLLVEYGPLIVNHASETLELITRDAIEEDGGVYYVVTAGTTPGDEGITGSNILTLDVCRLVANQMKVSRRRGHKSTGGNKYVVVTSTEGMQDLLDDENLLKRAMVPGNTNKPIMDNGLESYDVYNLRFIEYNYPVINEIVTYKASTDASVQAGKTYYERSGSESTGYTYTKVENPSGNPSSKGYYEVNTDVQVYHTYVFGENAYAVMDLSSAGIEMKRFGFDAKKGDNLGQIASLGWITMGFGAQVLDTLACTIIHHAVKNPLTRPTDIYAAQS
jgi:N4-gp56 family major capsid protein